MKEFKTKKEKLEYFNNIRKSYNEGQIVSELHLSELIDLVNNHPYSKEIIKDGIRNIKVDKDGYKNKCFYVIHPDGSETSFSPASAMKTKKNPKANFIEALRGHVIDDLVLVKNYHLSFYNKDGKTMSSMSGEWFPIEDIHVDHFEPKFRELAEEMIGTLDLNAVEYINRNGKMNLLADNVISDYWLHLHSSKAKLRILSKSENLNRTLSDNKPSIIEDYTIKNAKLFDELSCHNFIVFSDYEQFFNVIYLLMTLGINDDLEYWLFKHNVDEAKQQIEDGNLMFDFRKNTFHDQVWITDDYLRACEILNK